MAGGDMPHQKLPNARPIPQTIPPIMPSAKIYVIAGTHQQFSDYVQRKLTEEFAYAQDNHLIFNRSMSDYVYVNSPEQLKGLDDPNGVLIGTWRYLPHIESILKELMIRTDKQNNEKFFKIHDLYKSVKK